MKLSTIILALVLIIIGYNSVYRVQETEKAVLLYFGKIENANWSRVYTLSGLLLKR